MQSKRKGWLTRLLPDWWDWAEARSIIKQYLTYIFSLILAAITIWLIDYLGGWTGLSVYDDWAMNTGVILLELSIALFGGFYIDLILRAVSKKHRSTIDRTDWFLLVGLSCVLLAILLSLP